MYKSAICVKKCPDLNSDGSTELPCKATNVTTCPKTYFRTKDVWRTCVPDESAFKNGTAGWLAMQKFDTVVKGSGAGADALKEFSWEMAVCAFLAIIFNILFIYLMSKFPLLLMKISISLYETVMLFAIGLFVYLAT
jgi:hypothetical protein